MIHDDRWPQVMIFRYAGSKKFFGSTMFCVETIDFGSATFIFSYKIHL